MKLLLAIGGLRERWLAHVTFDTRGCSKVQTYNRCQPKLEPVYGLTPWSLELQMWVELSIDVECKLQVTSHLEGKAGSWASILTCG